MALFLSDNFFRTYQEVVVSLELCLDGQMTVAWLSSVEIAYSYFCQLRQSFALVCSKQGFVAY